MVCDCMFLQGIGELFFLNKNMDASYYVKILSNNLKKVLIILDLKILKSSKIEIQNIKVKLR
ncbi:hypothetical protein A0H76_2354 [Hepatospora eriocheir]|uniref:Uncharacterized protein n=1 Tax=Hepatospora eriocheir TaxID=1081669 RepID=A0A1X0QFJ5_9MICR|nr:hypothetical protein A0H76_2354 [Hepatospora eriocheir]